MVIHDDCLCRDAAQVNTSTYAPTSVPEACGSNARPGAGYTPPRAGGAIVCPVAFSWQPSRWADQFQGDGVSPPLGVQLLLPPAGYFCPGVCAHFGVPAGYRIENCQLVDIDECRVARNQGTAICGPHATCVNRARPSETSQPHGMLLNSTGYMCICQHDYFTVQMFPTVCRGQGLELTFVVAENVPEGHSSRRSALLANSTHNSTQLLPLPAVSALHMLKAMRQRVVENIQTLVGAADSTVPLLVFAASSQHTADSISAQAASLHSGGPTVWRVSIRLALAFVQLRDNTLHDIAAVTKDTFADQGSWPYGGFGGFRLQTQRVCSGGGGDDPTTACGTDSDCTDAGGGGGGVCGDEVAYMQTVLVEKTKDQISVEARGTALVLDSVKFDMASWQWDLELHVVVHPDEDALQRVLVLSKTRLLNGVAVYVKQQSSASGPPAAVDEAICGENTGGLALADVGNISACFADIARNYHVLRPFAELAHNSSTERLELRQFAGPITGPFQHLNHSYAREIVVASAPSTGMTRLRKIVVSLAYQDVMRQAGKHAESTDTTAQIVRFFVGIATLHTGGSEQQRRLTAVVETREIVTTLGTNYVLSHDDVSTGTGQTKEEDTLQNNMLVLPGMSISLSRVPSRTNHPPLGAPPQGGDAWAFITLQISLSASMMSEGISFDLIDVIPMDGVLASIAFFHDQPIVSHPYPCIFRPDMPAYDTFAGTFSCHSIQSVSCCCCLLAGGVLWDCGIVGLWSWLCRLVSVLSLSLVRTLPPTARLF